MRWTSVRFYEMDVIIAFIIVNQFKHKIIRFDRKLRCLVEEKSPDTFLFNVNMPPKNMLI